MDSQKLGFAFSLLAGIGILVISFALTRGLWTPGLSFSHFINLHAVYIAATGVGLLCSLAINVSFKKRIEALESAVNRMSGAK